jgi:hypothetical protein
MFAAAPAVLQATLRGHFYDPANMRQCGNRVASMVTTQAQVHIRTSWQQTRQQHH